MAPAEDDERHRREEAERRQKRKEAKSQKSDAQREKERKRKEHAQKILSKHGGERKKPKVEDTSANKSPFQELFVQRAQGFQIDFRFRNAPPRPPVGPCFVGNGLDGVLQDLSQYKPLNSVEVNFRWKLHSEPDLGVPLAPSAMDPRSYTPSTAEVKLHPDDQNLLDWKGSYGDTAAEELKKRRDNDRAAARLALLGKSPAKILPKPKIAVASSTRKSTSRVLDEAMQSWMKKTTYLSNDFNRKVHDFKSLAKSKQELAQDLELRQQEILQRRTAPAISKTFEECKKKVQAHPTKKHLKPVAEMPFLPNVEQWGNAFTHVVMDKSPGEETSLGKAFVANVQKRDANARMTCQVFVPSEEETKYQAIQQYELDVVPLKEEDAPHVTFCIWVDSERKIASYVPISSRVQLSLGRPLKKKNYRMEISRRPMNDEDKAEMDERISEVDVDVQERMNSGSGSGAKSKPQSSRMHIDSDDDDSDSDREDSFITGNKTIVAD